MPTSTFLTPCSKSSDQPTEVKVSIGATAPPFDLEGTLGTPESRRSYSLTEFRGSPVVLVFYPADASPVCTAQLMSYTNDIDRFGELGAQVLAISPQGVEQHEHFATQLGGLAFPLLADTERAVGGAYGVMGRIGFYRRSVFVVDGEGVVRYAHRATAGFTFRPVDELVEVLAGLTG